MFPILLVVLSVLAAFGLTRLTRRSGMRVSKPTIIIGALVTIAGALLTWYGGALLTEAFAMRDWPTTNGMILNVEVVGERAAHPNIVYTYRVDTGTYFDSTDLAQPSFGGRNARRDVANKRSMLYTPGDTVSVYYNPADPTRSALRPQPYWASYLKTGLGIVFVFLGMLLAIGFKRRDQAPPPDPLQT